MASQSRPTIELWTDGSTVTNPGPGGWSCVLVFDGHYRMISGSSPRATNNNMETAAVLGGLRALRVACTVKLFTDSMYVIRGLRALRYSRLLTTNTELWEQLQPLVRKHTVIATHVKGHQGVVLNEWVDDLAGEAARFQKGIDEYVQTVPEAYERRAERARKRKEKRLARLQGQAGHESHPAGR